MNNHPLSKRINVYFGTSFIFFFSILFIFSLTSVFAQTNEGFEAGGKTAYAAAYVTLGSGGWYLDDALNGNTASDRKIGSYATRVRNRIFANKHCKDGCRIRFSEDLRRAL